jgi:hypothetical protein
VLERLEESLDATHSIGRRCNGGVADREPNQYATQKVARLRTGREEHDECQKCDHHGAAEVGLRQA